MADPARYFVDVKFDYEKGEHDVYAARNQSGKWIKWEDFVDYKAAQRRNKTEESITQMGIEIAELRCRIAELEGGSK